MSRNGCIRKECMCHEGRAKKKVTFCASFGSQNVEEDSKEEGWQKSKNMIRTQKMKETKKTETRN
eukprot:395117-Karenia_brevis.AAC.1